MILTIRQPGPAASASGSRQGRTGACLECRACGKRSVLEWTFAAKAGQERDRGGLSRPSSVGLGATESCRLR